MPTYEFECERCGRAEEGVFAMSSMPDSVPCPCGSAARRVVSLNRNAVFVKDRPYEFRQDRCVQSFGRKYGRANPLKQHDNYVRYFDDIKKRKREISTSKNKHEMEWLGGMPGEMVDSISLHEGDKESVVKDPVKWLKKTGTYHGD